MKQTYTLITILLLSITGFAQNYEFGIIQNTTYNFSIVAIPDIASTTTTDVSDIGFTLMLPTGTIDVINETQFNGRTWGKNEITGAQLFAVGLGDGSRDAFIMNLPPGATPVAHGAGEQIVLISFDVSGTPTTGLLEILPNSDPIAVGLGGSADSFYNVNLDGPGGPAGTTDQFVGLAAGLESFNFSTLGIEDDTFNDLTFKAFPIPSDDMVTINNPSTSNLQYSVKNIIGQDMGIQGILGSNGNTEIRLGELDAAIYFIMITDGQRQKTLKIIKK